VVRAISVLLFCWVSVAGSATGGPVVVLTQSWRDRAANADYLHRGIEHAAKLGAQ